MKAEMSIRDAEEIAIKNGFVLQNKVCFFAQIIVCVKFLSIKQGMVVIGFGFIITKIFIFYRQSQC
jgi:hypothetical protein